MLDIRCFNDKPVLNVHPGIIPQTRGLDSFKWAIYNNDPIGVSLHKIDDQVDEGCVLEICKTQIFESDTIESLARRHFENEMNLICNPTRILEKMAKQGLVAYDFQRKPSTMRMPREKEKIMMSQFNMWKENQLSRSDVKKT